MKRPYWILLVLFVGISARAEDWKLVWSEEFDGPGLPDPARWDYETGFVRNNEQQLYTRARLENARIEGGRLIIEARKEQMKNPAHDPASPGPRNRNREYADYTSASLTTRGKASWTYATLAARD
jgi:beta-glucanase (GH16 family)